MPKFGGQGAQDAQVDGSVDFSGFGSSCPRCPRCFWPPWGAVFSIEELGVVLQYWSVLISNFRIARSGRGLLATTNNETLCLTSNEQRNTRALNECRATGFCSGFFSAITVAACYLLVKRRPASLMINEQRAKIKNSACAVRHPDNHGWFRRRADAIGGSGGG